MHKKISDITKIQCASVKGKFKLIVVLLTSKEKMATGLNLLDKTGNW